MSRRLLVAFATAALAFAGLVTAGPAAASPHHPRPALRPIVFVHGYSGSGAQFETQARRFASNGYPADWIEAQEYDSTFATETTDQLYTALDQRIEALLARTHADKVDLEAHSLGTGLMIAYLNSSPTRAARVAHYVNLDGATASAPPGGVPTMAIWGTGIGDLSRTIPGAVNLYNSDESHTQTVTSARTFAATYRFFTGRAPRTTDIAPQPLVRLGGRALLFPTNAAADGARLDVYLVNGATGRRLLPWPVYSKELTGDGSFGPFGGLGGAHYEFQLTQDGVRQHFYSQPFERTDLLIRLLTDRPGQGIDAIPQDSAATTNLIVTRYKEFWGDQGAADDVLTVNGTNIVSAAAEPRAKLAIAILTWDVGLDGVSHPDTAVPSLSALPFLAGTDLFLPARTPPTGTITLVDRQRAGTGRPDVLHVPDWPSATDRVSVQFNDFTRGESAAPES